MDWRETICPVCRAPAKEAMQEIDCGSCGRYRMTETASSAIAHVDDVEKRRAALAIAKARPIQRDMVPAINSGDLD